MITNRILAFFSRQGCTIPGVAWILFLSANSHAAGQLDPSFDPSLTYPGTRIFSAIPLRDGKILVGGLFSYVGTNPVWRTRGVARLLKDGSPDTNFLARVSFAGNPGNPIVASDGVYALAEQTDGKILIGGVFEDVGGVKRKGIARLNADGSLDPGFDPGEGIGGTSPFVRFGINRIQVQRDGQILIGAFSLVDPKPPSREALPLETMEMETYDARPVRQRARIQDNGRLDETYDPPSRPNPFSVRQSSGKVLIARAEKGLQLARLNSQGQPDPTFHQYQAAHAFSILSRYVSSVAVTSGDRILAGMLEIAPFIGFYSLRRFDSEGRLDKTFEHLENLDGGVQGIFPMPDGRILIAGTFKSIRGSNRPGLAMLTGDPVIEEIRVRPVEASASLGDHVEFTASDDLRSDSTSYQWFRNGASMPGETNRSVQISSVTLSDSGFYHVQVSKGTNVLSSSKGRLRILAAKAGRIDATFDPGQGPDAPVQALEIQPDGRILIGGAFTNVGGLLQSGVARLNPDGSRDLTFADGRLISIPPDDLFKRNGTSIFISNATASVIRLLPDGKFLLGGRFTRAQGQPRRGLARFHENGTLDPSFVVSTGPASDLDIQAIEIQPDGRIVIGGSFVFSPDPSSLGNIARLNPDGSLDTSFKAAVGIVCRGIVGSACPPAAVQALHLGANGYVTAAGLFDSPYGKGVVRFNREGVLDSAFNPRLTLYVGDQLDRGVPFLSTMQPDGGDQLILAGRFSLSGEQRQRVVQRFNADGSMDGNFDPAWTFLFSENNTEISALHVDPARGILISGNFSEVQGKPRNRFARLDAGGKLDPVFDAKLNGQARSIKIQRDQRILIAGDFTEINGQPRARLARIQPDPVDALELVNPSIDSSGFRSGMTTLPGFEYVFEFADSADQKIWTELSRLTGDGSAKIFLDNSSSAAGRFYRVKVKQF